MTGPAAQREGIGVEEVERRFGLRTRRHRIGGLEIRISEVEAVDEMVSEVYPDAVCEHGDAPVWMITWPAALGLAEHVALEERPCRVLEIGCGTAAAGIAAALAGAQVVCTDYDPIALSVARRNAVLSGCPDIEIRRLDWYRPDLPGEFDLVIGSEVVYFDRTFPALLAVLARYTAAGGKVLLADQGRPQVEAFRRMLEAGGWRIGEVRRVVHLEAESRPIRITSATRGPC